MSIMLRVLLAGILIFPAVAFGATLEGERTVVLTETSIENTYLAGADVRVDAPVEADLTAAGANVTITAPVAGDVLLAGGTLDVERNVEGDLRAAGARIIVDAEVGGDLAALGGVVLVTGKAHDIQLMGGTVRITGGANGDVTVFGSDVFLSGVYEGDVEVSASDRITVADGTIIRGSFRYNAPQAAAISDTATIAGGAVYTGASAYLPTAEQAQTFALAGAGVFFLVKVLATLVAAGLVVGLFPKFSSKFVSRLRNERPRHIALLALIGFGTLVATPFLIVLLAVSFVGIGISLILSALYFLTLMLAYVYAGLLVGTLVLSYVTKRINTTWKAALLGALLLYIIGLIPVVGGLAVFLLMLIAAGALGSIAYQFAWRSKDETP